MGKEIERKFLVDNAKWQKYIKPTGVLYRQGYILTDPEKTIRVRVTEKEGFLTVKGITVGATRLEYEYEIPVDDAKELLDNFSISELSKVRYMLVFAGKTWEVDEFIGDNSGLITAEVELLHEDEKIELPEWIYKEVTGEVKYYNSNLTLTPYKNWKD